MKLVKMIPEAAMVAAFLKAEFSSKRFSAELKKAMSKVGLSEKMVVEPDLESDAENELRARVLGVYRGYRLNRGIFEHFPDDLVWYEAELTREELNNLHYVDYSYWNELTDHTHRVGDAAVNIQNGKIVFGVSNDPYVAVAETIRRRRHNFEPMILWSKEDDTTLTILEGHLRATAFGLAGPQAPDTIKVIVGLQESPTS